ncbi:MAG: amidohydrolase [Gammaproteobacteria bacterium]|nr:amidohydrolase [Gammaproteobacteria bacterium]
MPDPRLGPLDNDTLAWVDARMPELSDWHQVIFDLGETAWREYRSSNWYIERLRAEGFSVEPGSGGMPTAFCAQWSNGEGPTIGGYAEYDAVPGNCQAADTRERPREGLTRHAGGHTDPHSALGIGALGGFLAAKAMMERHEIPGRLKFFGEPAEKVRGSKPIHAARGYYDELDAAISFHPFYMLPLCNTVRWNTHCGVAYAMVYSFECDQPETWLAQANDADSPIAAAHSAARAPGANDALVNMYQTSKSLREHMVAAGCGWSMNEFILTAGQATADNLPAQLAQIQYLMRVPTIEMAERVTRVLDANAAAAASISHCSWRRDWVSKSRHGLANHALADATFAALQKVGAPRFDTTEAVTAARDIQRSLGLEPMERPFLAATGELIEPRTAEAELRKQLPDWQEHFTSDDYTEYCWHAPTVRLYIARPTLASPAPGYRYPAWAMNALGGIRATIDPMIACAAKTIGLSVLELMTSNELLTAAQREFEQRTGGGIGGDNWQAPLCDYQPPIGFRWPEYITTERGREWWIPG